MLASILMAVGTGLAGASTAFAQMPTAGNVTRVVDGDTVDAQLIDGRAVQVRLIGIDAPESGECATDEATANMERLANGRALTFTDDPTQAPVDRFGRLLFYIDRDDGLDVGEEMIRAGWAEPFVVGEEFLRFEDYLRAEGRAASSNAGVWGDCEGDFHRSRADEVRAERRSAVAFMRRYYRRVSNRQFATAWAMLARRVRRDLGPFRRWSSGHRHSIGVSVLGARARLSRGRAVVTVRIRLRDRDACSGRIVRQFFAGRWILASREDSWVAVRVRIRKTRGGRVRLSKSECAPVRPQLPTPPHFDPPPLDCQGYDPCLPPGSDVDCSGGEGDGPRYVDGPVSVTGSDPYGLDGNNDGVGCTS